MTKKLIPHLARRAYLGTPHQVFAQMIGASLHKTTVLEVDFPIDAETLGARRLLRIKALIVQGLDSLGMDSRGFRGRWIEQLERSAHERYRFRIRFRDRRRGVA